MVGYKMLIRHTNWGVMKSFIIYYNCLLLDYSNYSQASQIQFLSNFAALINKLDI